jgi:glycogen synthase
LAVAPDIVLVGSHPPPHGGQAVHIVNLARHLEAQGLRPFFVNTGSDKTQQGDRLVSVGSSRALARQLLRMPAPRLIHLHSSSPTDLAKLAPVALAGAWRGIPWMLTVHSGNSRDRIRATPGWKRALARTLLRRAARVIGVSEGVSAALREFVGPQTVRMIPPHSASDGGGEPPADIAAFLARHTPAIVCIGVFEPIYGFNDAVRLLASVREAQPNAALILVGNPANSEECRALIRELGLEGRVMIAGNRSHADCQATLKRAAVLLRPTLFDGDSLSVREALALGVPVVATATEFRPKGVRLYHREVAGEAEAALLAAFASGGSAAAPTAGQENLAAVQRIYDEVWT